MPEILIHETLVGIKAPFRSELPNRTQVRALGQAAISTIQIPAFRSPQQPAERDLVSDVQLIHQVVGRNEEALIGLHERYRRLVFTIALRIVGDTNTAEEVVQDVFQATWECAGSFKSASDGKANVAAWLAGITRHRAVDATRTRRFRSRGREEQLDDERLMAQSPDMTEQLVLQAHVRQALNELPKVQKIAVELAYYGGLTHPEIAQVLGEPLGTIKSRVRLGLAKLRDLLDTGSEY